MSGPGLGVCDCCFLNFNRVVWDRGFVNLKSPVIFVCAVPRDFFKVVHSEVCWAVDLKIPPGSMRAIRDRWYLAWLAVDPENVGKTISIRGSTLMSYIMSRKCAWKARSVQQPPGSTVGENFALTQIHVSCIFRSVAVAIPFTALDGGRRGLQLSRGSITHASKFGLLNEWHLFIWRLTECQALCWEWKSKIVLVLKAKGIAWRTVNNLNNSSWCGREKDHLCLGKLGRVSQRKWHLFGS